MITIRRATTSDAALLANLAARTFAEAFGPDNRPEDLALHLAQAYGVPQQTAELEDPAVTSLFIEVDRSVAGYAQVRRGAAPSCVAARSPIELWRFYVDRHWHGQGVAQELMSAVVSTGVAGEHDVLWLGVWERNPHAQAFYRKSGFVDVGSQVYIVGSDAQTDRVMARPLPA
jgi:ribosomal protein S18 acetylase RimI-like enzyme